MTNDPFEHDVAIPDPVATDAALPLPPPPVLSEPSATRGSVRRQAALLAAAVIVFEGWLIARHGIRNHVTVFVASFGIVVPLLFMALTFAGTMSVRANVLSVVRGGAFALVALIVGALLSSGVGDPSLRASYACVGLSSVMALVPLACGLWITRRAFAWGAGLRAASLGLAAGLLGAGAIRIVCPNDALPHLVLGHVLPVALITLIGFAVGKRSARS